ncbi:MAG: zinc ribbon domain-containing protein [Candidatus Dormibacteraeota bacterium]|nr:zinc ribbon domain-containing protein [Candidatus Dormibacteraeota bacterium]
MISCPSCGLRLPDFARFCARCGRRLPAAARLAPHWVVVLFWAGTLVALGIAAIGVSELAVPTPPSQGVDPNQERLASVLIAVAAGCLFAAQLAAAIGLTAGRPWARPMATLVCVAWGLSCVGLLVSIPVLNAIWRDRRRTEPPLGRPPPF